MESVNRSDSYFAVAVEFQDEGVARRVVRHRPEPRLTVRLSAAPQTRSRARLAPDESAATILLPGEARIVALRWLLGLGAAIAAGWSLMVG